MQFRLWLEKKRSMRQRVAQAQELLPKTAFKSKKEMGAEMTAAFNRAQEINKENRGETPVYNMIHPSRLEDKEFTLDSALKFLTTPSPREVSVSVNKGVWSTGLVLAGEGKISAYWPTDVYTAPLPSGQKIPQAHDRPDDSHHWDEALIRLSDVEWETLYIGDDEEVMYGLGGWHKIKALAAKYDLWVDHISDARYGALGTQVGYEEDIKKLEQRAYNAHSQATEIWWKLEKHERELPPEIRAVFDKFYDKLGEWYAPETYGMTQDQIYDDWKGYAEELEDAESELEAAWEAWERHEYENL